MEIDEAKNLCAFDKLFTKSVPHILEKVFFSLDYETFKICMEVSNSWNKLLTSESLKKMGKSVFCEDIKRELYQASEDGDVKEVENILSTGMADVSCIWGPHGATPLNYASWKGHKDVVELLLDAGADPKNEDVKGHTPLHLAAEYGHKDVVKLLLDRGANPNPAANKGMTPLIDASYFGQKDVVQLLLDKGVEPNQRHNTTGYTPLHAAVLESHKDVVQLLLIRGADPSNVTVIGQTPLAIALQEGHSDIVNLLQGGVA